MVFIDVHNTDQTIVPITDSIQIGGKLYVLDFLVQYAKDMHYTSSWNIGGSKYVANGINCLEYWKKQPNKTNGRCYKMSVYVEESLKVKERDQQPPKKKNKIVESKQAKNQGERPTDVFYEFLKGIGEKEHTTIDFAPLLENGDFTLNERRHRSIHVSDTCTTTFVISEPLSWNPTKNEIRTYQVLGEGNCVPRAIALAVYGNEDQWTLIRCRAAHHLKSNFDEYVMLIGETRAREAWSFLTKCGAYLSNAEILIIACSLQRTIVAVSAFVQGILDAAAKKNESVKVVEEKIVNCIASYLPLVPANGIIAQKVEMEPIVIQWTEHMNHVELLCPASVIGTRSWLSGATLPVTYPPCIETIVKAGYEFVNINDYTAETRRILLHPWLLVAEEQLHSDPNMTRNTLPQYISTVINNAAFDDIRDELIKPFQLLGADQLLNQ